jgi:UDP-N-acetylmuramate dehydrogenase
MSAREPPHPFAPSLGAAVPPFPSSGALSFPGLPLRVRRSSLAERTTLGLGGPCTLYEPERVEDVAPALAVGRRLPLWLLGGGSNLVVPDEGLPGLVVSSERLVGVRHERNELVALAGTPLQALLRRAWHAGLSGLEPFVGIPAQVGGAVAMNAGGGECEIADRLAAVRLVSPSGRDAWEKVRRESFGYRRSPYPGAFVAEARFRLEPASEGSIRERMAEFSARKARTQPLSERSAGCIFRNPPGRSAGALVDRAGLKGHRVGGVEVSRRHANFIVARKGAKASHVLRLIAEIQDRVLTLFRVALEPEVRIWEAYPSLRGVA